MDKLVRKIEVPLAKRIIEKKGLYLVKKDDLDKLADIAANAYKDYPLHNWFNKGKYNPKVSKIIMKTSLKTMMKDAVIYADSKDLNGFAIWLPFGFTGSKIFPFIFNGGIKLIFMSGFGIISRLITYEKFAMKLKKQHTNNVDWYLYNLSIKKETQGKGISTKLLKPMLQFCDDEQTICYLETNKLSNVSLYEHYGFKLQEATFVPKSDVYHYAMTRTPLIKQ